ncbi:MAG: HlyD family secretion protein, partial [Acidobacteria bacterium]|nr:HlyD family secretion protein [Acidobacteriota bacterium]
MTATDTNNESTRRPAIEPGRARRLYLILGGAVGALVLIYLVYTLLTRGKESTDDAQVAADVVPVAARVGGQIVNVYIKENQVVHKGDPMVDIDPQDAQVRVAQAQGELDTAIAQASAADARVSIAQANARGALTAAQAGVQSSRQSVGSQASAVAEARASLDRARANAEKAANDWKRASDLGAKGDISRSQVDAARAANEAAQADVASASAKVSQAENARQALEAQVVQAQGKLQQSEPVSAQVAAAEAEARLAHARVATVTAALNASKLSLSYTKVVAPADGIASRLSIHTGSLVAAGQPLVQIVPRQTYVIANFKETQMREIRPGNEVEIKIDSLGRREFKGKVDSFSGGTGATFSLLPPDNASGNFVKVVQRVPVKVTWNGPPADQA